MTIHLHHDAFAELAASRGLRTYAEQAAAAGIGIGTMHRLRGGAPADSRSIAKICSGYGVGFDDLFVIKADKAVAA
nr:helix-turn-helix transcriptional regulator [Streptomyces sp. NBC_00974]